MYRPTRMPRRHSIRFLAAFLFTSLAILWVAEPAPRRSRPLKSGRLLTTITTSGTQSRLRRSRRMVASFAILSPMAKAEACSLSVT